MTSARDAKGNLLQKQRRGGGGKGGAPAPVPTQLPAQAQAPVIGTKDVAFKGAASALLPSLSGIDAANLTKTYGVGGQSKAPEEPTAITGEVRNSYLSRDRATQALNSLGSIGGNGPGVTFLKNAIALLQKYGAAGSGEGMSRASYNQFSTEFNSLLGSVKGDKAVTPYADLAQMFLNPTFTAGGLMQTDKTGAPAPSKKFYT